MRCPPECRGTVVLLPRLCAHQSARVQSRHGTRQFDQDDLAGAGLAPAVVLLSVSRVPVLSSVRLRA